MAAYFNKITAVGYHDIEKEIEHLKQTRPARIKALQAARALGDLSENAEYSAAKRDLRHLESRLRYLSKQLRYAQIVTPKADQTIEIGKQVTIEFLDDHDTENYEIVGRPEADVSQNKISEASPLGKALINQTVGDTVTVESPNGSYLVKVKAVTLTQ
ncbi:transcription elongation factor GreA [Agrilactobacillus fermenti]|uniref:transcription elongation factor GreA n=1 Tax=Agrilactobacillus fermenti TaxID=2586909 RepID=UPI003A5BB7D6